MKTGKTSNRAAYTGIFTSIAASICCLTPFLALVAGTSGIASAISWVAPLRPYLIGLTIIVLFFAWYQNFRPKVHEEIGCACKDEVKPTFWQSKSLLLLITAFAITMLTFPYYSNLFYAQPVKDVDYVSHSNIIKHTFDIEGMTCVGCEAHIESEINKLNGILLVKANHASANTVVEYDKTKTDLAAIRKSFNNAGYKIID